MTDDCVAALARIQEAIKQTIATSMEPSQNKTLSKYNNNNLNDRLNE